MFRVACGKRISLVLAAILAVSIAGLVATDPAHAGPHGGGGGGGARGGGGGGFHGGGGGFHGGGGGFHGGGGGFHGGGGGMHVGGGGFHGGGGMHVGGGGFHGGGMHAAGGPRGGGYHVIRPAPGMRQGGGHNFAGGPRGRGPSGIAAGNRAGPSNRAALGNRAIPNNRAVSNRVMQRNARAVGQAMSSRQMRSAMRTPGALRNPARRAAITAAVAGAAFAHHNGGLWWRHAHGGFGWVGPVFWPYAYDDFYDYAWWGDGYDPFWDYGYSDIYAGLFGPYDYGALSAYAAYMPGSAGSGSARQARARGGSDTTATLADMCGNDSKTIAGFPVEQFRNAIQPNDEQAAALDDLANASQKASQTIRDSCPKDVALTAPSRVAAMQQRVQAMRDAVGTVKPALDKFYGLLSDDQKAKITALASEQRSAQKDNASTGSCSAAQPGATDWPSDAIERSVKPTDAQRASLTALQDAATKAADILKASCAPTEARTPPARLDAVAARLDAMLQAIGTVRPPLDDFYNSLTDEQKAAFDAIGPERNGPTTASADDSDESPPQRRSSHRRHRHGINVPGMVFRMMGL